MIITRTALNFFSDVMRTWEILLAEYIKAKFTVVPHFIVFFIKLNIYMLKRNLILVIAFSKDQGFCKSGCLFRLESGESSISSPASFQFSDHDFQRHLWISYLIYSLTFVLAQFFAFGSGLP